MLSGVGIRIRKIPLRAIAPGAVVDGPSIFDADLGYEIDNMEGLDVHRTEDGDIVLTMVSDDNFSHAAADAAAAVHAGGVSCSPDSAPADCQPECRFAHPGYSENKTAGRCRPFETQSRS